VLIALSVLLGPFDLTAREKRGAWLRIEKTDGSKFEGELLKVSGETLVLLLGGSHSGGEVSLDEIKTLGIKRKKNVWGGIGIGFLGGLAGGYFIGKVSESGDPCQDFILQVSTAFFGAILGMLTGGLIGGSKRFKEESLAGLADKEMVALLQKLNGLARDRRLAEEWSKEAKNGNAN
jgi:hypothetical protein